MIFHMVYKSGQISL